MDCLVTKLKGVVIDDSLLKLGVLRVKFEKQGSAAVSIKFAQGGGTISLSDGMLLSEGGSIKEIKDTYRRSVDFSTIPNGYLEITNFYDLETLEFSYGTIFNESSMLYATKLTSLAAENINVDYLPNSLETLKSLTSTTGSFNQFNLPNLKSLTLPRIGKNADINTMLGISKPSYISITLSDFVNGNINNLNWKIESLFVDGTNVKGVINDFLKSQRGYNVGGALIFVSNRGFTWNAPLSDVAERYKAEFSASDIKLYKYPYSGTTTLYATYNVASDTWTLA